MLTITWIPYLDSICTGPMYAVSPREWNCSNITITHEKNHLLHWLWVRINWWETEHRLSLVSGWSHPFLKNCQQVRGSHWRNWLTDTALICSINKWLFQWMPEGRHILLQLWIWTIWCLHCTFYSSGGNIRKYWWNIPGDLKAVTATLGGNLHLLVQLKSGAVAINKLMQKGNILL